LRPQRSVLIVDRSEDSQEVLRTVLERRGWRTLAARRAEEGLEMARRYQPDLIVLDLELEECPPEDVYPRFERQASASGHHLIALGTVRPRGAGHGHGQFVAKPYHYGPLVRRIEQMLEQRSVVARAG